MNNNKEDINIKSEETLNFEKELTNIKKIKDTNIQILSKEELTSDETFLDIEDDILKTFKRKKIISKGWKYFMVLIFVLCIISVLIFLILSI